MKKIFIILCATIGLLLIPYITSQFNDEVNWSVVDFIIGGLMLFGLGMLLQFLMSKLNGKKYRVFVIIGVVVIFLLIWVELAVGIFN